MDADTGEVRVPRLLGVFAAGRIVSPAQARSQLIGGMTMGLSMALHEESAMDPQFGDYPNHDLAGYHIAAHADVQDIDAVWIDEEEPDLGSTSCAAGRRSPVGSSGDQGDGPDAGRRSHLALLRQRGSGRPHGFLAPWLAEHRHAARAAVPGGGRAGHPPRCPDDGHVSVLGSCGVAALDWLVAHA